MTVAHPLDRPEVLACIFHPRRDVGSRRPEGSIDLDIPVTSGVALGARFHPGPARSPCVLFFHGNGEIASDYDDLAPFFVRAGAGLLAVDYRGYGRSGGVPTVANLLEDSHRVLEFVPDWLKKQGQAGPLVVMGRSLGSAPALELAAQHPEAVSGLILDSAFAHGAALLRRLGLDVDGLALDRAAEDIFDQSAKIGRFAHSTLIVHGERDAIIPLADARQLFDASAADDKRLLVIPQADHNTLLLFGLDTYFDAVKSMLHRAL